MDIIEIKSENSSDGEGQANRKPECNDGNNGGEGSTRTREEDSVVKRLPPRTRKREEFRRRRVSYKQLETLWDHLRVNRGLATGKNKSAQAREDSRNMWITITQKLNSKGDGAIKDWKGWSKYWNDYKAKLKIKKVNLSSHRKTRSGPAMPDLTAIEKKFISFLGEGFGSRIPGPSIPPQDNSRDLAAAGPSSSKMTLSRFALTPPPPPLDLTPPPPLDRPKALPLRRLRVVRLMRAPTSPVELPPQPSPTSPDSPPQPSPTSPESPPKSSPTSPVELSPQPSRTSSAELSPQRSPDLPPQPSPTSSPDLPTQLSPVASPPPSPHTTSPPAPHHSPHRHFTSPLAARRTIRRRRNKTLTAEAARRAVIRVAEERVDVLRELVQEVREIKELFRAVLTPREES